MGWASFLFSCEVSLLKDSQPAPHPALETTCRLHGPKGYHDRGGEHEAQSRCSLGQYNVKRDLMESITIESIPIIVGREEDGRWWADIDSMPGAMADGATRESP